LPDPNYGGNYILEFILTGFDQWASILLINYFIEYLRNFP